MILFIAMFLHGSYYAALSLTITTTTKSIQFGLYIPRRSQHLPQVCEVVGYVLKQVFKKHNSSSRLKIYHVTNNTHTENYILHSFHVDKTVSHVNWWNSFAAI